MAMNTLPKGCNPGKGCFNCPYPDCVNPDSFRLSKEERGMLKCGWTIPRAIQRKREYKRAYYRQHRQEIYERTQAYYQKHRQEIREYNQAYRQQHRQEMREYNRTYYQKHRQKILEYQRAYRQQHRQEILEARRKRRQKRLDE